MENYRLTQTGEEVQEILNGAAMQTDLTAENERAEGAEQTLQGNIDEEERRAKAAEQTLQGNIDEEERRAKAAEETLGGAIDDINAKIPAAASSENKLADQDFVNSSIETATATFRGTYNLVSDLHLAVDATHEQIATLLGTVIAEADNNDYSYVLVPTSAQTPTEIASIEKYTFGANGWAFAYALNNSGFTSAQWAAINSGITSGLVAKLTALPTNADLLLLLAGKQDVLTFDDVPVEGSTNPVKSGGVHSAIDDEKTARVNAMNALSGRVDTIEGEIPATASSENKLVDQNQMNSSISTATATFRGAFNLISDLGLTVSATHTQIGTALAGEILTADNNDYAFVQVPTSDETPAQILKVERYKFNGTAWVFEYELNNSGFTAAQWAALNSGITSGLVGKLNALPTNDELTLALAGKQDVLTFDNTPTENSNNPVKSGGVYAADKALSDAIEAILLLIPSAATSLNKLVDTDLMNSSISTATATFRGTFNLVSDLSLDLTATHAQIATALAGAIATADNNDYCFVQIPTAVGTPTEIAQTDRYKFNGTAWAFEYTLNNSGFTAAQWAAINSAITTELVAKLTALPTNAELLESLGLLSSGISGINAKIPSAASSENKLVDGTAMETYVAQIVNAIDATFNVTSTDGHVTLAITQVNGVITSVQLTTSDIASAAALNLKASQADLTALAGRVTTAEGNITSLTGRMTTAESDIDTLTDLYNALQQSAPQVIQPTDTWPVANPSTTVIYRVIDRVNTPPEYYSDYMWNGTAFVLMATYNNAIDDVPTAGSNNLVKSGGVFNTINPLSSVLNVNSTQMSIEIGLAEKYVDWNTHRAESFSPYSISEPIELCIGDHITARCAANSAISVFSKCNEDLTSFTPLVQGPNPQNYVNIDYVATENCYVCFSWLTEVGITARIERSDSLHNLSKEVSNLNGRTTISISPEIGADSYYIDWTTAAKTPLSSYIVSKPIHLLKGDTIVANCAANSDVAILSKCNYGLSLFTKLVQGPNPQGYKDIEYEATETCYVCLCYLKNTAVTVSINTDVNILNLRDSLLNVTTDSLQLNPLYGKSVLFEGDSICAGEGSAHGIYPEGWAGLIGVDNQMDFINQSINGSTIESIADRIQYYYEHGRTQFDYVILEGGTNDADTMGIANLGTLSPLDSFDDVYGTGTFYERMERLLQLVIRLYPSAKIGFIVAQKMGSNNVYNNRRLFFDAVINCCKKWGISYVDLWNSNPMNPNIVEYYPGTPYASAAEAAANGSYYIDGQHLSYIGYEYLQNNIQAWMKTL